MNILIVGLCLKGNKGGPALALSLNKVISKYTQVDTVTLTVPGGKGFQSECLQGEEFGFEVVEYFSLKSFLKKSFYQKACRQRFGKWLQVIRASDVVIDMTAISYVGPPTGKIRATISGRFFYFLLTKLLRKKFLAWTQSYGPFTSILTRFLAKLDLGNQKIVFCRGELCKSQVMELLPNKQVESYPDVATLLDYNKMFGTDYLFNNYNIDAKQEKLITISPSSVIYEKSEGEGLSNTHVKSLSKFIDCIIDRGYSVVLVPHTLTQNGSTPNNCDLEVSKLIASSVASTNNLFVIEDDLDPVALKSIISNAFIHIGGRYHSCVAALSSAVPCISISWHSKYHDLMKMYNADKYVVDGEQKSIDKSLLVMIENIETQHQDFKTNLAERQCGVVDRVLKNAEQFTELMHG